jgi:ribosomal RNA-processing protein 8
MFAVPGWAVSVKSLVSTLPSDIPSASGGAENALPSSKSKSKKRKQDEVVPRSDARVTSEDLQQLWSKTLGDDANVHQKSSRVKKKQKQVKQRGAAVQYDAHAVLKARRENGSNANGKNDLNSNVVSQTQIKAEAGKKRKMKPRGVPTSQKSVIKPSEEVETKEMTGPAQRSEHDRIDKNSALMLQNKKFQHAPQKLQSLLSPPSTKLTPLQAKMREKLTSSRFRHLNETLYRSPSSASFNLFTASPDLFAEYHAGFAQQVKDSWPENPVEGYVRDIRVRARAQFKGNNHYSAADFLPLPRRKTGSCTIADLGCGDASLARVLQPNSKALNLRFHNFDFHTINPLVTKADIASLPLRDGEVDIAIFCLSLMGTNWTSFIEEAWRVLRGDGKGELWVAEVKSRFGNFRRDLDIDSTAGKKRNPQERKQQAAKSANPEDDDTELFAEDHDDLSQDETDISAFVNVLQRRGFALRPESVNRRNKMFVSMVLNKAGVPSAGKHRGSKWNGHEYQKTGVSTSGRKKFTGEDNEYGRNFSPEEEANVLKPCVYKKR